MIAYLLLILFAAVSKQANSKMEQANQISIESKNLKICKTNPALDLDFYCGYYSRLNPLDFHQGMAYSFGIGLFNSADAGSSESERAVEIEILSLT